MIHCSKNSQNSAKDFVKLNVYENNNYGFLLVFSGTVTLLIIVQRRNFKFSIFNVTPSYSDSTSKYIRITLHYYIPAYEEVSISLTISKVNNLNFKVHFLKFVIEL